LYRQKAGRGFACVGRRKHLGNVFVSGKWRRGKGQIDESRRRRRCGRSRRQTAPFVLVFEGEGRVRPYHPGPPSTEKGEKTYTISIRERGKEEEKSTRRKEKCGGSVWGRVSIGLAGGKIDLQPGKKKGEEDRNKRNGRLTRKRVGKGGDVPDLFLFPVRGGEGANREMKKRDKCSVPQRPLTGAAFFPRGEVGGKLGK